MLIYQSVLRILRESIFLEFINTLFYSKVVIPQIDFFPLKSLEIYHSFFHDLIVEHL